MAEVGKLVRASIELGIILCSWTLPLHGHPSLHSYSPLFTPLVYPYMVTLLCTHIHPCPAFMMTLVLMVTLLYTYMYDHPSLMFTLFCTRGHLFFCTRGHLFSALVVTFSHYSMIPSSHSWLHGTVLCTLGHSSFTHDYPFLHSWSSFSTLMVPTFNHLCILQW